MRFSGDCIVVLSDLVYGFGSIQVDVGLKTKEFRVQNRGLNACPCLVLALEAPNFMVV